jgi:hypothetical protein
MLEDTNLVESELRTLQQDYKEDLDVEIRVGKQIFKVNPTIFCLIHF